MEKVILDSKELIYLASIVGVDNFIGIHDGFYGMSHKEILAEIENIKSSLISKKYAQKDFEGNFIVEDSIITLVKNCSGSKKYLLFDKISNNSNVSLKFYINSNFIYCISDNNKHYSIEKVESQKIESLLQENIKLGNVSKVSEESLIIENSVLNQIKGLIISDSSHEELENRGLEGQLYVALIKALRGELDYISILTINKEGNNGAAVFILDSGGIIELKGDRKDNVENTEIAYVSSETFSLRIKGLLDDLELLK